jgi:hypothetical protein
MKYCENIFCSRALLALPILSIILVFLSNMITTDSFAKGGFEQQQKQQFKDTVAVTSATEQLRVSKSLSGDLNIRQTQILTAHRQRRQLTRIAGLRQKIRIIGSLSIMISMGLDLAIRQ